MLRIEALAIVLLAIATYATRAGGLWLIGFVRMTPRRQALLRHLSGSVIAAILAPIIVLGDVGTMAGTAAAILVMLLANRPLAALAAAALAAAIIRLSGVSI